MEMVQWYGKGEKTINKKTEDKLKKKQKKTHTHTHPHPKKKNGKARHFVQMWKEAQTKPFLGNAGALTPVCLLSTVITKVFGRKWSRTAPVTSHFWRSFVCLLSYFLSMVPPFEPVAGNRGQHPTVTMLLLIKRHSERCQHGSKWVVEVGIGVVGWWQHDVCDASTLTKLLRLNMVDLKDQLPIQQVHFQAAHGYNPLWSHHHQSQEKLTLWWSSRSPRLPELQMIPVFLSEFWPRGQRCG